MLSWKERVTKWAEDRNLVRGSSPTLQMSKLLEEVQELSDGLLRNDTAEICDAIGDIQVVLAVMCAQLGQDIDECREMAWEEIKDRKGKMVDGVFVKEDTIRGSGRTTKQMQASAKDAIYVWPNDKTINYAVILAKAIDRGDLEIVSPAQFNDAHIERFRGRRISEIVVDHATELNAEQQRNYNWAKAVIASSPNKL